jgi:glycosyltransferase involved in cell wall biosynthesis
VLKVALVHFAFDDYTIELANGLIDHVDLTLIHPETSAACEPWLDPRIQVRRFTKPRLRDPRNLIAMQALVRIIRAVQPDVLHVQENDPWYDLTALFKQLPPVVTTIHDVFHHPGDWESLAISLTRKLTFYRSQQLIVHTELLRAVLIEQFRVPPPRVNVVAHGELGSLYQRRTTAPTVPREPHTLLFFGRIWPYKGLHYLLEALPLVAAEIPDVKLIIAGRGENLGQYFPQGHDPQRIELLNQFIPPAAVAGLFQRSAAVVLPYIEASQSGVAALAYGIGTPVIATNLGGLSEIVRPDVDGLLVPPRDVPALAAAIVRLLRDQTMQQALHSAARERCQTDLNWQKIGGQTAQIYQAVGQAPPGPARLSA